ncbi:MAG: 2OG-Fe(II) oxygenase [Polyangiaceae bacterium]|nr:2OG-Fe(II) oxygenase [Polyangiaceae bacterium]
MASGTLRASDLELQVKNVGLVLWPILPEAAAQLAGVAQRSPFGKGKKTLYDDKVRSSTEITAKQIKINARKWEAALRPKISKMGQALGLPKGSVPAVTFDKLIVYGPGQFFAPHKDSERADDMFGTLVVELPSAYEGGDFIVQHGAEKKVFQAPKGSKTELRLIAFYADCLHEVKPVTSGHRIVLTYQLRHAGGIDNRPIRESSQRTEHLTQIVKSYFSTPVAPSYSLGQATHPPDRLVYLLDHEYSEKSLSWEHLKNGDRPRANALAEVADRLDCEIYLALADIHENWSCGGEWDRGESLGYRDDDGDDDDNAAADDVSQWEKHELIDLIESSGELTHWVARDGSASPIVPTYVGDDEMCCTRETVALEPFKSEYEGPMGNSGNTEERWYHRAAVVMWPRSKSFVMHAEASPEWAIDQLTELVKKKAVEEARDKAKSLLPFWRGIGTHTLKAASIRKLLKLPLSLGNAELASQLLAPLSARCLTAVNVPSFIPLVNEYGVTWAQNLLNTGRGSYVSVRFEHARGFHEDASGLPRLADVCKALREANTKACSELALWLVTTSIDEFKDRERASRRMPLYERETKAATALAETLGALFEAAMAIDAEVLRRDLAGFLLAPNTKLPSMIAAEVLLQLRKNHSLTSLQAFGLGNLYRHTVSQFERFAKAPERAPTDWSLVPPPGCTCDLCGTLGDFLRDPNRTQFPWPLAGDRRAHIHQIIDGAKLPVSHETARVGRPYTLVLKKKPSLFEEDKALRARQKAMLEALQKEQGVFGK